GPSVRSGTLSGWSPVVRSSSGAVPPSVGSRRMRVMNDTTRKTFRARFADAGHRADTGPCCEDGKAGPTVYTGPGRSRFKHGRIGSAHRKVAARDRSTVSGARARIAEVADFRDDLAHRTPGGHRKGQAMTAFDGALLPLSTTAEERDRAADIA